MATIDELVISNPDFLQQYRQQLDLVQDPDNVPPDLYLKEKIRQRDRTQARLDAAEETKAEIVARYDEEILRHQERIDQLEEEITDLTGGQNPIDPPKRVPLSSLEGIGARRLTLLQRNGITEVDHLARSQPTEIAKILGVTEATAKTFIVRAREALSG